MILFVLDSVDCDGEAAGEAGAEGAAEAEGDAEEGEESEGPAKEIVTAAPGIGMFPDFTVPRMIPVEFELPGAAWLDAADCSWIAAGVLSALLDDELIDDEGLGGLPAAGLFEGGLLCGAVPGAGLFCDGVCAAAIASANHSTLVSAQQRRVALIAPIGPFLSSQHLVTCPRAPFLR